MRFAVTLVEGGKKPVLEEGPRDITFFTSVDVIGISYGGAFRFSDATLPLTFTVPGRPKNARQDFKQ